MGLESPFSDEQNDWFAATIPHFERMLGPKGSRICATDQATMREWIGEQWHAFYVEYGDKLSSEIPLGKWREKYSRKYWNYKKDWLKANPLKPTFRPLVNFPSAPPPNARQLYLASQKQSIKREVNAQRLANGGDTHLNVALHQRIAKERWASLSEAEKDQWFKEAIELAKSDEDESWKNPCIFQNQKELPDVLAMYLKGMIGPGPRRVGEAAFHVMFSFRNEEGEMSAGYVTVGGDDDPDSFVKSLGSLHDRLASLWYTWSETYVHVQPDNELFESYPRLDYDEDSVTNTQLRGILKRYFQQLWEAVQTDAVEMPSWDIMLADPGTYIDRSDLPSDIKVSDPDVMRGPELQMFASYVLQLQNSGACERPPFFFRKIPSNQSASSTTVYDSGPSHSISHSGDSPQGSIISRCEDGDTTVFTVFDDGDKHESDAPLHRTSANRKRIVLSRTSSPEPATVSLNNKSLVIGVQARDEDTVATTLLNHGIEETSHTEGNAGGRPYEHMLNGDVGSETAVNSAQDDRILAEERDFEAPQDAYVAENDENHTMHSDGNPSTPPIDTLSSNVLGAVTPTGQELETSISTQQEDQALPVAGDTLPATATKSKRKRETNGIVKSASPKRKRREAAAEEPAAALEGRQPRNRNPSERARYSLEQATSQTKTRASRS